LGDSGLFRLGANSRRTPDNIRELKKLGFSCIGKAVSRRRSVDTLRGYVRDAELFKDHAGAGLL
jgi:hypothetical protein